MFQVVHDDLEEYSQKVVLQGNFQDWWQIMEQDERGEAYPVLVQLENGEALLLVPWACMPSGTTNPSVPPPTCPVPSTFRPLPEVTSTVRSRANRL